MTGVQTCALPISEDMESLRDVWYMMEEAMSLPPLQEEDFTTKETEA